MRNRPALSGGRTSSALKLLRLGLRRTAALEASRAIARLTGRGAVRVEAVPVSHRGVRQTFVLPAPAVQLLTEMLMHLGAATPVMVIPKHAELTTEQTADFLDVSRPWIIKLIEPCELPHCMVGMHRLILFSELRAYRERRKGSGDGRVRITPITLGLHRPVRCLRPPNAPATAASF